MKKFFSIMLLALGIATASPALAQPTMVENEAQSADTTCTTACVPQGDSTVQGVILTGEGLFGGYGAAVFEGETGYALVEKIGGANIDITGQVAGGLCTDNPDCTSGDFSLVGNAFEHVSAKGGAMSEISGTPALVHNEGGAAAQLNFIYGRINVPVTSMPSSD